MSAWISAGAEGAVVDADVVDQAVEEAAGAAAVGADAPGVRAADAAGDGAARDLGAVDVEAGGGAVEGGGEVLPLAGDGVVAGVEVAGETAAEREVVAGREVVDPEHRAGCRPRCRRSPTSFLVAVSFCTQASSVKPLW